MDFEPLFATADAVPGWLSREQARRLYDEVRALPTGATVLEIGTHQGRSAIVLAGAREDVRLVAVDPLAPDWRYGATDTEGRLREHLARAGVADRVELVVRRSEEVRPGWDRPLDLVYVDGKHDARSTAHDLLWAAFLPPGGRVLVHDSFSSVGVTLALLATVLPSRRLRYRGRVGSLATFERGRPRWRDRMALVAQLPWWLRNVVVKVLLRLRLRPVARALGHHDSADPY